MKSLQNLSYKTLFTILFFAIAGIVLLTKFTKPNPAAAGWWDEMWHYRKAISVTNSSGSNQNNTQIKILDNYDLSSLVTEEKLQTDLDDIRFTDINGNIINYWIEDSTNSSVDIWGVIPSLPISGSTIYMYYGNPSATSVSTTSNITIGGTMISSGGYRIHIFNENGTLTNAKTENVEVLVVAGGGGGASSTGAGGGGAGGGGAGGLSYNASYALTKGQIINVTVGVGGTNGTTSSNQVGTDGGNSVFGTITVNGGGGGANTGANGRPGGSGGGGGYNHYSTVRYGGAGVIGVGNSGGNTSNLSYAGGAGGGGAAGVGGDNKVSHAGGDGGLGINYSITGVGITYATGGKGGGGAGAVNKTANTGNGGDGSYAAGVATSGASGIVVVRYLSGAASSPTTEETGTGPIAYWKFDEGSGPTAYDSSSNQNNGTISGATYTSEDQCISGKCLYFDNTNKVQTPSSTTFNTSTMTIEMWLKLTDNGQWFGIYRGASGSNQWYFYNDASNAATFSWFVSGTRYNISAGSPNINEWHHFTIIISPGLQQTYRDGKLISSSTIASGLNATDGIIKLGEYSSIGSYNLTGYLDEVKIYPYARTAEQIKLDYNSHGSSKGSSVNLGIKSNTAPSLKSSLVAHYKFDEGNGSTIYDSSNNNKNGVMDSGSSAPTWNNNGHSNKSLNFDGNDSITLANEIVSTSSIRTNGITYSAWIKPTNINYGHIVGQKPSNGYSSIASGGIDINSGKARMIAYDDNIAYKYATGNTTLIPNQWYFITGIYNPSDQKIKIYVNGKFDGGETSVITFSRLISNDYNIIGSYNHTGNFFSGLIDEVKIYNRALTEEEIKQDYNQGSAVQFGSTTQNIGGTTTSLEYCIPGDSSYCASPVAEWNFEENTGTVAKDTSGNNNNGNFGTGSSAPTWAVGAQNKGAGVNLDGNDNLTVANSPSLNIIGSNITISGWSYLKNCNNYGTIAHKDSQYSLAFYNDNGICKVTYADNSNWNYGSFGYHGNIPLNSWHYIAVTKDSSNLTSLYIDGQKIISKNFGGSISGNNNEITIGRYTTIGYINGSLDQVKIYSYARTPAQIAYDYNKGAPVGWWKFDECQGNIANDSSGVGNTGVIVIGSSGTQNSLGTCQIGTSAAWTNGATGKTNASLNFDGVDDYVKVVSTNNLDGFSQMSVFFWIKPMENATNEMITKWAGSTYNNWEIYQAGLNIYGRINGTTGGCSSTGNYLSLSEWHQVGMIWDGNNIQMFIDGIKRSGSCPRITTMASSTSPLYIGRINETDNTYPFLGQIDDVRIYNYALTSEQVKNVYNGGAVNFQ